MPIEGGFLMPPPPAGGLSAAEVESGMRGLPAGFIQQAVRR